MFDKLTREMRDTLYLNSDMFLSSNRELVIENCQRIEEYNDVYIRIASGGLFIHIWGNSLRADGFRSGGLRVHGRISRLELTERSRRSVEDNKQG
ncbi:YabP/YqfC family sporulation protein [Ruminococcus sp. XPD3002]|jgi:hypothetical protein|uniref:YabP/YqfC family sporulation protein n=1 Tax=Ruminococcus sp. XPD3002 TaxID=1452269 RepID=UPI00091732BB|nr:YabP/YqfC family sporulation protein [Ruminococcus sp.]SFX95029.1 YabP family protein [Ruminococcus flavefaciens]HPY86174.1 YabP/YqfC family sporulation protein [Ruminococcus flavefaciens]HRU98183.1 YabP/YqfC family sporulation protein [Ruminococcus sp.]